MRVPKSVGRDKNTSFRGTIIKVDDSPRLRAFTRIHNGRMMDTSTLCLLKNAIRERTWRRLNRLLAQAAVAEKRIDGERLRIDTTAVETNIHWPTDSALLWDSYRVLSRLLHALRDLVPDRVSGKRLHPKQAKRLHASIGRTAGRRSKRSRRDRKLFYGRLIALLQRLLDMVADVCPGVLAEMVRCKRSATDIIAAEGIV